MLNTKKAFSSTIGLKFLMAITGIALVLFTIVHLAENLLLLNPDGSVFNAYASNLLSLGILINIAELILFVLAVVHVGLAVTLRLRASRARPVGYDQARSKMGPSKMGFASRNLIITGLVLFAFLIWHILSFRLGPGEAQGYVTTIGGKSVRDLHRVVFESFHNPLIVAAYEAVMIFLLFHLKHGFWSSFQSLGATNDRTSTPIYRAGILIACVLAIGFMLIPLGIYFDVPAHFAGGGS